MEASSLTKKINSQPWDNPQELPLSKKVKEISDYIIIIFVLLAKTCKSY